MAKDNPSKRSGPGTPKTQKTSKPGAEKKVRKKNWDKTRWIQHATEVGIEGAENMTIAKIRASLKKLREEGKLEDGRKNNGREPKNYAEAIQRIQESYVEIGEENVKLLIEDRSQPNGQPTVIELTRVQAALMKLYDIGMKKNNPSALVAFLDRISGKAKQSVEHSGEIKADEQKEPTKEELAAAEAYENALLTKPSPSPYVLN